MLAEMTEESTEVSRDLEPCAEEPQKIPQRDHTSSYCASLLPESVPGGSGLKLKQEMLLWSEGRNIGISSRGAAHSARCEVL